MREAHVLMICRQQQDDWAISYCKCYMTHDIVQLFYVIRTSESNLADPGVYA